MKSRKRSGRMWDVIDLMKGAKDGETLVDVLGRKDQAERDAAAKEHVEHLFKHGDWSQEQDRLFEEPEDPVIGFYRQTRQRERDTDLGEFQ